MQKASTGIQGLDAQLGGGVPIGTLHLIIGEPLNGYELLALHLASGAPKALYCSAFQTRDEILKGISAVRGNPTHVRVAQVEEKMQTPAAPERFVIDDFSMYAELVGQERALEFVVRLRKYCSDSKVEGFLFAPPGVLNVELQTRVIQVCDGLFELGMERVRSGMYPYLMLKKMRGAPDSSKYLNFREQDGGMFIDSTRRVN